MAQYEELTFYLTLKIRFYTSLLPFFTIDLPSFNAIILERYFIYPILGYSNVNTQYLK